MNAKQLDHGLCLLHVKILIATALVSSPEILAGTSRSQAQGITNTIAIQGDAPPEGNGTFALFDTPVLNDAGQVAFGVRLINTSDAPDDDYGIYRADVTPGSLVNIDREFLNAIGLGVRNLQATPAINNAGQVVTHRRSLGLRGGDRDQYRISDGSSATTIDLFGDAAPDGNGTFPDMLPLRPALNDASQVVFLSDLTGTNAGLDDDFGMFRDSGGTTTQIVREGQTAPNANGTFRYFNAPALNNVGQAAFRGFISVTFPTAHEGGIFRGSGGAVTRIVREGQAAPDANGTFIEFGFDPVLNDSGQVAFEATLAGTSGGPDDDQGIFRGAGGTITQIARESQNLGVGLVDLNLSMINNAGQAVFRATQTGLLGGDQRRILRGFGGPLTVIATETQVAPDGNGMFNDLDGPEINDAGQVAFVGELAGTSGTTSDDRGIFLGDGQEIITVAREGLPLAGSTVSSVSTFSSSFAGGYGRGGRRGLNEFAQVAFQALLTNGKEGVFLFTPELHWRTNWDGSWDDRSNWTISTQPAQVHQVLIDPDIRTTVDGPAVAATVRSLEVGGGADDATLVLQSSGPLTATEGLTIETNGAVSGAGIITADVSSAGSIGPGLSIGSMAIEGNYDQSGDLLMDISSPTSFDTLSVTGEALLAGTLEASLLDGFTPSAGDVFEILTAAGGFGGTTFTTELLPALSGNLVWNVNYQPNTVSLLVSLPGDFDFDGNVDGFDFLKWQRSESPDPLSATDLADWEVNFGAVASSAIAAQAAAPEPATGIMLMLGMAAMRFRRHVPMVSHQALCNIPGIRPDTSIALTSSRRLHS